jgi:hypothetical protein
LFIKGSIVWVGRLLASIFEIFYGRFPGTTHEHIAFSGASQPSASEKREFLWLNETNPPLINNSRLPRFSRAMVRDVKNDTEKTFQASASRRREAV